MRDSTSPVLLPSAAPSLMESDAPIAQPTVLNIAQNYHIRGGSDRYFFELEALLTRHGHCGIPFAARHPRNHATEWSRYFPPSLDFQQPRWRDMLRFVYSRSAAKALRRLLRDHPPQIAHLHIYYGQLTSSILSELKAAGIPLVQTLHDFKLVCPVYSLMSQGRICEACRGKHYWRAVTRRCNRGSWLRSAVSALEAYVARALGAVSQVDRFIAVSHFQRAKFIELGVPAEKLVTIHNFQDTSTKTPAEHVGQHFLYFGRMERLKGIFTLLRAAEQIPDVPLLMVGEGEAELEIAATIRARRLKHVHLLGFQQGPELEETIRNSIATILPSEGYDNCPLAVLESLAWARPVIGSKIGGIPELIDDEQDGFLFPPGDAEVLVERMNWFARHRRAALAMGRQGRYKIEQHFSPTVHYEKLCAVYRELLGAFSQAAFAC